MSFATALLELNARLRVGRHRCCVEQRAASLVLRATLPERDYPERRRQQRLPLGLPADYSSLPEAERQAIELGHQLRTSTFTWEAWTHETHPEPPPSIDVHAAAQALHAARYATSPERGARAWNKKWAPALRKLPSSGGITASVIRTTIERMQAGSATRRDQGSILAQVAASVGWDPEPIRQAARGYSAAALQPRSIPTDSQIEAVFRRLAQPHWQWAWAACAAFGLRPHELDHLRFTPENVAVVSDETKTCTRHVFACPSRWLSEFHLFELPRPQRQGANSTSKAMADALHRANISLTVYSLRHAYALRLMDNGVPPELGARLMGHSLQVHESTYKRWLDADRIVATMQRFNL